VLPAASIAVACNQSWVPDAGATEEKLKPGPGEITVDQAVAAARAFFPKIGLDVPAVVPAASRYTWKGKPGGDVALVFGGEAMMTVNARTGAVAYYVNTRRQSERWHGVFGGGPPLLRDVLAARNYVFGVMKGIGMPDDYRLSELRCRFPGDPPGPGMDRGPRVDAAFQPAPFGYRLRDWFDKREIILDTEDGSVLIYRSSSSVDYRVESCEDRLKLSEAQALAAPVVEKYSVGKQGAGPFASLVKPSTDPSELMLVLPNGELGGVEYDRFEKPVRLRLAWVLHYSDYDEVWIDAADGRVLGGHTLGWDDLAIAKAMKRTGMGGP
jgi:hypothetical protein